MASCANSLTKSEDFQDISRVGFYVHVPFVAHLLSGEGLSYFSLLLFLLHFVSLDYGACEVRCAVLTNIFHGRSKLLHPILDGCTWDLFARHPPHI